MNKSTSYPFPPAPQLPRSYPARNTFASQIQSPQLLACMQDTKSESPCYMIGKAKRYSDRNKMRST